MSDEIRFQLREDILSKSPDWCATKWVLEPVPFLFLDSDLRVLWDWKRDLAVRLGVDPKDVAITGSGAVGVSLSPFKALKSFDSASDVDVAVISAYHFDLAWRTLRSLGTRRFSLTPAQRTAVDEHVRRYVYWGTIATDRLLPILPFASEWMEALRVMGECSPTEGRQISVRIYRDYNSLRAYLHSGFKGLRDRLLAPDVAPVPIVESSALQDQ